MTVWRALHVHRYADQDAFLVNGLAPVLADLRAAGVLQRSFFLRYWQGGPHLRVRLRLDPAAADDVTAEVAGRLRRWLAGAAGDAPFDAERFHRDAQPTLAALEEAAAETVHPPDTVRAAPYQPELGKYGGPRGVAIAEEFFDRSSAVVLAALPAVAGVSGRRLGAGFGAMLRGLRAAGLTAPEMAAFLAHYCVLWSPYVFDQFLETWPDLLAARRPTLLPHAEAVLAMPGTTGDPFAAAVGDADAAVREAAGEVLGAVTLLGDDAPRERRHRALLVSYLHTHNNRLGLTPEHEAFLGFLGHHVLSACAGQEPAPDLLPNLLRHRAERLATVT
ncbi:MAG TPA: lantibiotic dehydratase C-terminal domain-containing protein [Pseudonocardiaceae bacterium]